LVVNSPLLGALGFHDQGMQNDLETSQASLLFKTEGFIRGEIIISMGASLNPFLPQNVRINKKSEYSKEANSFGS